MQLLCSPLEALVLPLDRRNGFQKAHLCSTPIHITRIARSRARSPGVRCAKVTLEEGRQRLVDAVRVALHAGYRLVDTSLSSGPGLGKASSMPTSAEPSLLQAWSQPLWKALKTAACSSARYASPRSLVCNVHAVYSLDSPGDLWLNKEATSTCTLLSKRCASLSGKFIAPLVNKS